MSQMKVPLPWSIKVDWLVSTQLQIILVKHRLMGGESPLGKHSQSALRLAYFFAHLQGMNSDHAKDQKKLAELLKEIKQALLHESLGGEKLIQMSFPEIQAILSEANAQKIA